MVRQLKVIKLSKSVKTYDGVEERVYALVRVQKLAERAMLRKVEFLGVPQGIVGVKMKTFYHKSFDEAVKRAQRLEFMEAL